MAKSSGENSISAILLTANSDVGKEHLSDIPTQKEAHMNFLVWIIFGALAGWIASILMGKNRQMGAIANIVVGIVGAFLGSWIMSLFGGQGVTGFNFSSILVAIGGAVVLLFVVRLFRR
jgi:uncharacterized membrane protein YeaQ/YmgE (transglycosylase-associated protein family)